eukprot:4605897-Pyramimonas_sp.AAC.1
MQRALMRVLRRATPIWQCQFICTANRKRLDCHYWHAHHVSDAAARAGTASATSASHANQSLSLWCTCCST